MRGKGGRVCDKVCEGLFCAFDVLAACDAKGVGRVGSVCATLIFLLFLFLKSTSKEAPKSRHIPRLKTEGHRDHAQKRSPSLCASRKLGLQLTAPIDRRDLIPLPVDPAQSHAPWATGLA